jgi:hypothetical protein
MKTNFINLLAGKLTLTLGLIFAATLLVPQAVDAQSDTSLIAPTILSPQAAEFVTERQPVFTGVTYNDTLVDVYIDGVLSGRAKVKNSPSGVASWAYRPAADLALGNHVVFTLAKSQAEVLQSLESINVAFRLEEPFPTPTLLTPLVDSRTTYTRPYVNGVSVSESIVDVYIDGSLTSTIQVASDPSGTANFEYRVPELAPGWHSVKVQAKDSRGKLSNFTDSQVFEVRTTAAEKQSTAPKATGSAHEPATAVIAPTLINPANGLVTDLSKPVIAGLAHNQQSVEIFIDGTLNGEIEKQEHESGVFSFTYKPYLGLTPGIHTVSAKTVDANGEKSSRSNTLSFLIKSKTTHLVISPDGISQTRLVARTGAVAATSTEEVIEPQAMEDKTDEVMVESTEPKVDEEAMQTSESTMEESTTMTDEEPEEETEIVVIGERADDDADAAESDGNTALVVILAIAAIIIIGLISWYTSREEQDSDDDLSAGTNKSANPNESKTEELTWTEEPTDVGPPDYLVEDNTKDDIPPPPPPPALGI